MLAVQQLECARGDRSLFCDLSFTLKPGEVMHVVGANGSGKTTLLRAICGLTLPMRGAVQWQGVNIDDLRGDYYQQLTHIGHQNGINGELTAVENLQFHNKVWNPDLDFDAHHLLADFGLARVSHLPTKLLSQGQKRRVALARLKVTRASLWILDEPLSALDASTVEYMYTLFAQHIEAGGMILITSHQSLAMEIDVIQKIELATP